MATAEYNQFLSLIKSGAFAEAVALAEKQSVLAGDKNEFWLTQLSFAYTRAGKKREAIESAEKALIIAPKNRYALLARADALMAAAEYAKALQSYEESLDNERTVVRARRGVLSCLVNLKNWTRLLELTSQWEIDQELANSFRVKTLNGLGRSDEAMELCRNWLRIRPDQPQALWELTNLEVKKEGLEAVRSRMGRLARIPGKPPVYAEIYASLSRKAGSNETAVEQYTKLAHQQGNPRILRQQAFALAKSGRELEALPIMEELLRLDPRDMYIHTSYTAACQRVDKLEHAWKFYHELLALHPDEKTLLGRLRKLQKRLESAGPPSNQANEDL